MSKRSPYPNAPKGAPRLHPIIHEIEPLLDYQRFTLAKLDFDGKDANDFRSPIRKCIKAGVLRKIGREHYEGKARHRYEWADGAREHLQTHLEQLDKLPCGHRTHIPCSTDDPDGIISCKFCGTEYDEERFKEMVLD